MAAPQFLCRFLRPRIIIPCPRSLSNSTFRRAKHDNHGHMSAPLRRETRKPNPFHPHLRNATLPNTSDFPKVGTQMGSPDLISAVDPNFSPTDPVRGNSERVTGGMQGSGTQMAELGIGEIEVIIFRIEQLRRQGEDTITMRARLLCP